MNKDRVEQDIFRVTILLKGIYSLFELLAGAILLFVTSPRLFNFVHYIFRNELLEDAHDFIANFILNLIGNLPSSIKLFIAIYLISHGIIKIGLIIALWKEKRWAYPVALVVFGLFIVYQIYRYILHPSLILIFLTDLDMAVIILTWLEWMRLKSKREREKK